MISWDRTTIYKRIRDKTSEQSSKFLCLVFSVILLLESLFLRAKGRIPLHAAKISSRLTITNKNYAHSLLNKGTWRTNTIQEKKVVVTFNTEITWDFIEDELNFIFVWLRKCREFSDRICGTSHCLTKPRQHKNDSTILPKQTDVIFLLQHIS